MAAPALTPRLARAEDLDELRTLMAASIEELQKPFLTADQIASSWTIMGLDIQLIDEGPISSLRSTGRSLAAVAGAGALRFMAAINRLVEMLLC